MKKKSAKNTPSQSVSPKPSNPIIKKKKGIRISGKEIHTRGLTLNNSKTGAYMFINKDPFVASIIEVQKPIEFKNNAKEKPKPPYGITIDRFTYTPLLTKYEATSLAKSQDYNNDSCIELFWQINHFYSNQIAYFYNSHADTFDLPKGMKFANVKQRVIDQASIVLNLHDCNKVKESIKLFALAFLMNENSQLFKELNAAAQLEYNYLSRLGGKKDELQTTLRQQMILLERFGFIDNLEKENISVINQAKLIAILLNKDPDNIRHFLTSISSLNPFISKPSEYRKEVKKSKFTTQWDIYTSDNIDFIEGLLSELLPTKE